MKLCFCKEQNLIFLHIVWAGRAEGRYFSGRLKDSVCNQAAVIVALSPHLFRPR